MIQELRRYTISYFSNNKKTLSWLLEISGNNDKYVLMYDAASGKWKDVNPDVIVSAAATEPIQPGLPNDFINTLDIDLDNKIDLDAGSF